MNTPKRFVVITSIFAPTEAVRRFARLSDWQVIVVGDRKTPADWHCDGVNLLTAARQESSQSHLAKLLPWNHYCRKMLGYIEAIRLGAEYIADTDDDNLPHEGWDFPASEGTFESVPAAQGFVNMYRLFTKQPIWPRGFPLKRIQQAEALPELSPLKQNFRVGVWQGLADGDPDVDAIYRLTCNAPCYFERRAPVVLDRDTLSPFNSQNTLFVKDLFPLLYLPASVTFRFTDILRGLVAQPIMWRYGYHLGFSNATVTQERNAHDYLNDFESEIPCYLYPERIIEVVDSSIKDGNTVCENLLSAYESLCQEKLIPATEMPILEAWIKDVGLEPKQSL